MLFCNMVGNYWVELAGYKRHIARIGKFGQLNKYKINLAVDCIRYTNKYYCQRKVYKHDKCNCNNQFIYCFHVFLIILYLTTSNRKVNVLEIENWNLKI